MSQYYSKAEILNKFNSIKGKWCFFNNGVNILPYAYLPTIGKVLCYSSSGYSVVYKNRIMNAMVYNQTLSHVRLNSLYLIKAIFNKEGSFKST